MHNKKERIPMKKTLISMLLVGCCCFSMTTMAKSPRETVEKTINDVLVVLKDGSLSEDEKRDNVTALISRRFDFPGMSQRILATNWKNAPLEQKKKFVELFRALLGNTYWKRIKTYKNERVEIVSESIKQGKTAKVITIIQGETQAIPVDYKLRLKQDKWLAYDVIIEQVSLVRNYQVSFQNIIKNEGMEALLADMQAKLDTARNEKS